jgi:hypothetical protein
LLQVIKQRLQKTKEGSRHESGKLRLSPVAGIHSSNLSLTAPPTVFAQAKPILISPSTHIPLRQNMNRFQRNSVEGLNVVSFSISLVQQDTHLVGPFYFIEFDH